MNKQKYCDRCNFVIRPNLIIIYPEPTYIKDLQHDRRIFLCEKCRKDLYKVIEEFIDDFNELQDEPEFLTVRK